MMLAGRLVSQLCGVMLVGTVERVGGVGTIGKSVMRGDCGRYMGKGGWVGKIGMSVTRCDVGRYMGMGGRSR